MRLLAHMPVVNPARGGVTLKGARRAARQTVVASKDDGTSMSLGPVTIWSRFRTLAARVTAPRRIGRDIIRNGMRTEPLLNSTLGAISALKRKDNIARLRGVGQA